MRILRHIEACSGQGLLEVVAVIGTFSALLAVAMPAYLGLQSRKDDKRARSHLLAAVWTADAYRADHGSYIGMDALDLLKIDGRVPATLTVAWARRGRYCLTDTQRGSTWSILGPYRGSAKFTASADCA